VRTQDTVRERDSTEVAKSSSDDEVRRQTWARKVGIPREFSKITLGKCERSYNISFFHFAVAFKNFYPTLYLPNPLVKFVQVVPSLEQYVEGSTGKGAMIYYYHYSW